MKTTLTTEQATHVRRVDMENVSYSDRRHEREGYQVDTLADVAISLDEAAEWDIDNSGGSGIGAGAFLEAIICTPDENGGWNEDADNEPGELVTSIDDPLFAHLPNGDVKALRTFIAKQKRSHCWDGHNHVTAPHHHSENLLNRIRGRV